jgi:hypothetical protein
MSVAFYIQYCGCKLSQVLNFFTRKQLDNFPTDDKENHLADYSFAICLTV